MRLSPPAALVSLAGHARRHLGSAGDAALPHLARLAPLIERARAAIRRHPKLAAGLDAVTGVWTRLVDAFCETIDPYLARVFPDLRLVAIVEADGNLAFYQTRSGDGGEPLPVTPETLDATTAWSSVELRLRADQVLKRTLSLPDSSRAFLGPIIEHRLERLTPWKPDQVLFGYRIVESEQPSPTISIEIEATARDIVAAPLARLASLGLAPTAIGAQGGAIAVAPSIVLQRGGGATRRPASRIVVSRIALASLAALSILALFAGLYASAADDARDETAARLVKARRLLRNASNGAAGTPEKAMLDAKRPDRAMIVIIDRLAASIPPSTVLKQLAITPDKVRLAGRSGDAPALVGKLEATGLADVRFTAPVTREKDGTDSFELTAERRAVEGTPP